MTVWFSIFLTAAHAQEAWEGYRFVDSDEVRALDLPFLAFAEAAVLDTETVGMFRTLSEPFRVVDVETVPPETNRHVLSNPKDVVPFQIETCRKQGLRWCPVLDFTTSGTMFFNNGTFRTCRHGFHNWIALASHLNNRSVSTISPPIILRVRREGRTVAIYNSGYEDRPQLRFSFINDDARLNFQTDVGESYPTQHLAILSAQADYVEMTLDELILPNFRLAEVNSAMDRPGPGEVTYLFGYPGKTDAFPDGIGDAPGYRLMVSVGRVDGFMTDFTFMETTNFATPGMSGGVVITADGRIVGLHCNGDLDGVAGDDPALAGSYSYPLDRDLMENYWSSLQYPDKQELARVQAFWPVVPDE